MAEHPTIADINELPEKFRRAYDRFTEIHIGLRPTRIIRYLDTACGALFLEAEDSRGRRAVHQVLVFGDKTEYDYSNLGKRL